MAPSNLRTSAPAELVGVLHPKVGWKHRLILKYSEAGAPAWKYVYIYILPGHWFNVYFLVSPKLSRFRPKIQRHKKKVFQVIQVYVYVFFFCSSFEANK